MRPPIDIAVEAGLSPTYDVNSPTSCPGPTEFTTISKPMFPDMKHDFMSKSTASTRETSGDFLSISTDHDDHYNWRYRGMQDAQVRRVGTGDKPVEDQYNSPNRDVGGKVSNRVVNSMDWNQSPTYLRRDPMLPSRSTSRTRERSEFVEEQSNRRLSDGYDGAENGTYQRAEVRDRIGEYKRPQHHFENEEYAPHRNGRDAYAEKEILRDSPVLNREHRLPTPVNTFGSGTPKSTVERAQTFEGGTTRGSREDIYRKNSNQNYQTEKGQDYGRHEKFFTELQRNGSFSAENGTYDRQVKQREVQGRVEEHDRWYSAGDTGDRFSEQDGGGGYYEGRGERTMTPDEVRRRNHPREGMNLRRDNDPRMNAMQGNSNRREGYDNIRTYDDDWSNERYLSKTRKKGERHAVEEDSISQSFSFSETSAEDRGRRRSASRARSRSRRDPSTETSQHARRHKSSERMGTKPSEFVIDIVQPGVESYQPMQSDTIISPSQVTSKLQNDALAPTASPYVVEDSLERELYAKRIADANLMKEQSEARHQILKEVRQAMEMRDLSTDARNRRFWERQMKTLNASLKRLWDVDDEESFSISEDRDDEINFEEQKLNKTSLRNIHAEESPNYKPEPKTPTLSNTRNDRETQNQSPTVSQNQPPMVLSPASINNFTTIKVQAPESLPAGHQFTIRVNGKQMKAQVPSGGVNKGDVFTIRIPLNTPPAPSPPTLQIPPTLQNTPSPSTPISSPLTATPSAPSFSVNDSTVKVRAPASMPEGYRFTAKMGDRTIVATVPRGGVQKGEVFVVRVDQ